MFNVKKCDLVKESLYEAILPNGLKLIVIPKKGFTKQFAMYATHYGSNNIDFYPVGSETVVKVPLGIAHFLEHKMFDNPNGENVMQLFAQSGAQPNAFTSNNITTYFFESTNEFYKNLEILINYVNQPYFTEESVEKEKGIIAQEITMYDDEPNSVLRKMFLQNCYLNHPIKNDIAGAVDDIMQITHDMLYLCYNNFYNPANMVLVVGGDLDPNEVYENAAKFVLNDKRHLAVGEVKNVDIVEPDAVVSHYSESRMDVSRPKVIYGFKDNHVGLCGKDILKRDIAMQIAMSLFAGKSSDLFNKLYEKQIIDSSFDFGYSCSHDYAFGLFVAETDRYKELVEELKNEIILFKKKEINITEFERIKKGLIGSLVRSFNNIESLVINNTFYSFEGIDMFDNYDILNALIPNDVKEAFSTSFEEEYCTTAVILPRQSK